MKYQNKVLVIGYQMPAEGEDADTFTSFFNISQEELLDRTGKTFKLFRESNENDLALFFIRMLDEGILLPTDVLFMAIQHWIQPIIKSEEKVMKMLRAFTGKFGEEGTE
jgi:hypothetical protein